MRSALTISSRWRSSTTASVSAGSGSRPNCATNRAARNMRSGSSRNDTSGASGVRNRRAARSAAPSNGSTSSGSGSRNAIAFTVKSRRERSVSTSSEYFTSGLRLSGRYTSARNVVISITVSSLRHPDRAEPLPLEPDRVGPTADDLLHRVGTRVGGEVDVGSLAVARHPIEERVAHAPAYEVALVARVGDQARELLRRPRRVEQRLETGRDRGHSHHCRRPGRSNLRNLPAHPNRAARAPLPSARGRCTYLLTSRVRRGGRLGLRVRRARVPRVARPHLHPGSRRRSALPTPRRPALPAARAGTSSTAAPPKPGCGPVGRLRPRLGLPPRPTPAHRERPARARPCPAPGPRLPFDITPEPAPGVSADDTTPRTWSPHDRPGPEFERVLDARTPLLARAFDSARPTDSA